VTLKITNENGKEYSVDLTLAVKCESWPEDAKEWRTRHRTGIVKFLTEKHELTYFPAYDYITLVVFTCIVEQLFW